MEARGKEILTSIGIGVAFMLIAIIVQSLVQSIPTVYLIFKNGIRNGAEDILSLEMNETLLYSLYIGLTAGIMQELFKYVSVEFKPKDMAIWIGLGFSLVDIAFLLIETAVEIAVTSKVNLSLGSTLFYSSAVLLLLNVLFSLAFHPGTAMILKFGRMARRKISTLILAIGLHTLVDGGLVYADILVVLRHYSFLTVSSIYWSMTGIIGIISISLGLYLIRKV